MSNPSGMNGPNEVSIQEAASVLRLPAESVEALVGAGYLPATSRSKDRVAIPLTDLKAFIARNVDDAPGDSVDDVLDRIEQVSSDPELDPETFLTALEQRSGTMADRTLEIFTTVFPEASGWTEDRRRDFLSQAVDRFDAILAVARLGDRVDDGLLGDLESVGEAAAMTGSPLPEILLTLRISRDLMVQTAVEVAEDRRHGALALSIVLTQILPAMDRLTDAVARGYWAAVVRREEESWVRYQHVVEHSSDGIYEVDLAGTLTYANPSLGLIIGRDASTLIGLQLDDVLVPVGSDDDPDAFDQLGGWRDVDIRRPDGVDRHLSIRVIERRHHGAVVGHGGVVRDVTNERDLEAQKNEFLAFMTQELRQPVTTILGLGITLSSYADELASNRVRRIGTSVHQQAERIARLADDLFDISRIEANSLLVNPREIDLLGAVDAALSMIDRSADADLAVSVPAGIIVLADPRRLEQVIAHLVENAFRHGAPPVTIEGVSHEGIAELRVTDEGPGLGDDPAALFDRLGPRALLRRGGTGPGLGLPLARGLVEAMGGRVTHRERSAGGAQLVVELAVTR